ncbi:MAG: hypothetical protein HY062_17560 [Bacteroidetes bacterium]|nr:hypothetical protein [Bacteroidota bacterium]
MIKLKEVIVQLSKEHYLEIEKSFIKNKADRFLFLLNSYKHSSISDKEIIEKLQLTANSFYVLKSRLYDKIQEFLSTDIYADQEETIKLLLQEPNLCLNSPRETAVAYLLKLEKELLRYDMHNELLVVYSALKKTHLNSDKYYRYSQLYNKQVSFGLSLEKAEDTLADFCRLLSQYDFSRSEEVYEKLCFLKKEINDIYVFCSSRQFELIKNLIELQLNIFCKRGQALDVDIDELIQQTKIIFDELPITLTHKKWEIVLDYLCFEYYYSIKSNKLAIQYFDKVNNQLNNLFLFNHIGLVSGFLSSRIKFCIEFNMLDKISSVLDINKILFDTNDIHIQMSLKFHNAMLFFYQKKYKQAITIIRELHNEYVFKDYFHEYLDTNLTLLYLYIITGEFEEAQLYLKTLMRRVRIDGSEKYTHVLYLLKAFDLDINKDLTAKNTVKQKELLILFEAGNNKNSNYRVINQIMPELKKKYQI